MFKGTYFRQPFKKIIDMALLPALLLLILWSVTDTAQAHTCGPTIVNVEVGQTVSWQITAGVGENPTTYTPTSLGSFFTLSPDKVFNAFHGVFTITGIAAGTSTFSVVWFFSADPGGSGTCSATVTVSNPPFIGESELASISSLIDSLTGLSSQDKTELSTMLTCTDSILAVPGISIDVKRKMVDVLLCALLAKLDVVDISEADELTLLVLASTVLELDQALLVAELPTLDFSFLLDFDFLNLEPPVAECKVTILVREGGKFNPPSNGRATIRSFFSSGNKQMKAVGDPEGGTYKWSIEPPDTVIHDDGLIIQTDLADLETFGDGSQASTNISTRKAVEVIKSGTSAFYDQYTVKVKYTAPNQAMCEDEMDVIVSVNRP